MLKQFIVIIFILNLLFSPIANAAANNATVTHSITTSIAPILQKLLPAVVNITAQGETLVSTPLPTQNNNPRSPLPPPTLQPFQSLGSGVIVAADKGYILTNAHVVNQANTIMVTLSDGRRLPAKLLGADLPSDIAVLQIKAEHLVAIPLADSDSLQVGDFVAAIGNPFGLNQTVTSGIISALQRNNLGIESYENFIQTDASINPGNSGGALVDMQGHLIGINTAILSATGTNSGIGFAIPSNMARDIMYQLLKYGSVARGVIGTQVQTLTPELAQAFHAPAMTKGALVTQLIANSPAAFAGIKTGDIITAVNDKPIKDGPSLRNITGLFRIGTQIKISLLREGKLMALKLSGIDPKQYKQSLMTNDPFLYGLTLENFDEQVPGQGRIRGIMVLQVAKNSAAARALPALQRGDVIVSANQQAINNLEQLQQALKLDKKQLLLNVLRGNGAFFVVIK